MTEIQVMNSMNQSIISKITEYKNKEIKKDELNKFMLLNLCHILTTTNKIKLKNENIQKKQDIEIKKSLSKIKSYQGNINYNSKDLESKNIMKKLQNPTLESYIPISEISYSTEIQFYKKDSDKCNFNESLLFKKKEKKEFENEEKEIDFEEPPIIYLKHSNNVKNIKKEKNSLNMINSINNINNINCINIIKNSKDDDDIFELINKDDDDLFNKEENENQYKNILFYELENYFDEDNKDYLCNDDNLELDFKKIESFFYLDDIFLNQRLSRRNSSDIYNNMSSLSGSTSFGSRNTSGAEINKEIYQNEFINYMSLEFFKKICEQMSIDYLRYMLVVYSNAITASKKCFYCENKMFLNIMKSFILKIGISSKKLYEKIIQNLINNNSNNKDKICNFENFVKSFSYILKPKEDNNILKYIFIISLFRLGEEEDINVKHINIFLQLIKGKMIYNGEIYDEFQHNLIKRYDRIYSYDISTNFKFGKILICLESFFDKKGSHN